MLFVPSVWQDIRKYYENSYVKFQEYGDTLFYIKRVRETEIIGVDENDDEFVLTLDEDVPFNLTYTLPHKGLFVIDGSPHLLHRVPAVQYSRGLTQQNTKIVEVITGKARSISFNMLRAYVTKQPYVPLETIMQEKWRGGGGVCLSRRISYNKSRATLYVDTQPVALVNVKEKKIEVVAPQFQPEIKALLSSDNQITFV